MPPQDKIVLLLLSVTMVSLTECHVQYEYQYKYVDGAIATWLPLCLVALNVCCLSDFI